MNPSVEDRLASIVRAMNDIILPALPAEESLARDLSQMIIAHLQILRAQVDEAPKYEQEELSDAQALGRALLEKGDGGKEVQAALSALRKAIDGGGAGPRQARAAIYHAIDAVIRKTAIDGGAAFQKQLPDILITLQYARAMKDRTWFAPMGFDNGMIE